MERTAKNTEVLIVGAGPSGLMMACQLALHKIPFRIIDKNDHSITSSGALIVHARSLEILQQMGIADKAVERGLKARKIKTGFNGKRHICLNIEELGKGISSFTGLLLLEQTATEQLLIDFLFEYGFSVERNTELIFFSQVVNRVTALLKLPEGKEEEVNVSYLVAADGGQSLVRRLLKIPFLGKTHELSLFVFDGKADCDIPADEICFSFTNKAGCGIFPLKRNRKRVDGTILREINAGKTLDFEDITTGFAGKTRLDVKLHDPEWFSVFHSHQQYAASFRQNRCFLVGDAAHVLSPVGAQGMNTGMQDAYNLAWKLSFVIRKIADERLLNTYHAERFPVAKKLVHSTERAFQLVTSEHFFLKNFRLYVAPLLLRFLFRAIERKKNLQRFVFKGISQTGICYREGSSAYIASMGNFVHKAPKPGQRLPYICFWQNGKNVNIQDKVNGSGFHLFVFAGKNGAQEFMTVTKTYRNFLSSEMIPGSPETEELYRIFGIRNSGFYLVRPDLYIAARSDRLQNGDLIQFIGKLLL